MPSKPSFRLKLEHFVTRDESLALKKLFKSFTTASAETLFTHSEITILKYLVSKKGNKQSTQKVADTLGMAGVTVTAK